MRQARTPLLTRPPRSDSRRRSPPTFLWDGTFGWTRHGNNSGTFVGVGTNFGLDVLGIPGTNGPDPRQSGIPRFSISGYETLGNPSGWQPNYYGDTTFSIDQNFSLIKNAHNIRFGFQGLRHHMNHWQPEIGGGPRGRFDFNRGITGLNGGPSLNQFNAYASFLMGLPQIMRKSLQWEKMAIFNPQLGWYIRDRWQATPQAHADSRSALRALSHDDKGRTWRHRVLGPGDEHRVPRRSRRQPSGPRHRHEQENVRPESGVGLPRHGQHGDSGRLWHHLQSHAAGPAVAGILSIGHRPGLSK